MDSHVLRHSPAATALPRWLVVGFVSGFIAVLIFHQGAAAFLHALQWTPRAPYSMAAVAPLGVPQVLSLAFWGGVWGVLLAFVLARLDGAMLVLAATVSAPSCRHSLPGSSSRRSKGSRRLPLSCPAC